jgi:hypothetical protein
MPLAPLAAVKHRVQLGQPLPFGVRDADGTLLLARGHLIEGAPQLDALLARGALVELGELADALSLARLAPRDQLPRLWAEAIRRLDQTLTDHAAAGFVAALDEASAPLSALVARDSDLAIFHVLHQGAGEDLTCGMRRSLQTARKLARSSARSDSSRSTATRRWTSARSATPPASTPQRAKGSCAT